MVNFIRLTLSCHLNPYEFFLIRQKERKMFLKPPCIGAQIFDESIEGRRRREGGEEGGGRGVGGGRERGEREVHRNGRKGGMEWVVFYIGWMWRGVST